MIPVYCTGIDHPPKSTILSPRRTCSAWSGVFLIAVSAGTGESVGCGGLVSMRLGGQGLGNSPIAIRVDVSRVCARQKYYEVDRPRRSPLRPFSHSGTHPR